MAQEDRPKLEMALSSWDWSLELISIVGLLGSILIVAYYYNELPVIIPRHFDASGNPDRFGQKALIWSLPSILLVVYSVLTIGQRFPHAFNYPLEITSENARRQYYNSILMIRVLKVVIVLSFFWITFIIVMTGLGRISGLGLFFLPVFLIFVLGTVVGFVYRGFRLK